MIDHSELKDLQARLINGDRQIYEFLRRREIYKYKVFFIIDDANKYVGTVTDGDLRSFLLEKSRLPNSLYEIANTASNFVLQSELNDNEVHPFVNSLSGEFPILSDNNEVVGIFPSNQVGHTLSQARFSATSIAPMRISFAGGGSDVNYWFDKNQGCVVNLTINKYARVTIKRNFSKYFNISSVNTNEKLHLSVSELENYSSEKLSIITSCLKACRIHDGLDIDVYCDVDPGTGLGGSSSLVVATVKAVAEIFNFKFTKKQLIKFCYDVERNRLGIQGGWQDQIAAVYGGLCTTNFDNGDFATHKIDLSSEYEDLFNSSLFLLPVGKQRASSDIHQKQRLAAEKIDYVEKMKKIVELAKYCSEMIGQEKLDAFGDILHSGWILKRSLGDFISTIEIDNLYQKLREFGAAGGRLLGAGSSGYLLVYVHAASQPEFLEKCQYNGISIERLKIDTRGVRVI